MLSWPMMDYPFRPDAELESFSKLDSWYFQNPRGKGDFVF